MEDIIELPLTQTSKSIHTSSIVSPENVWVIVGMSLLSSIQQAICIIVYVIPVMCGYMVYQATCRTSESIHTSPAMLLLLNLGNME